MNKLNKYYEEILKKVHSLLETKQYEEAFEIVSQEIASPYIPAEYIEIFEKFYVDLNKIVMVNQIKNRYSSMSKMEMLGKAYDGKKIDVNLFCYLLGKYCKEFDNVDLQYINKIFTNKAIANDEKIFVLQQLKLAEVTYTFDFLNIVLNKTYKINTTDDFEYSKHPYFKNVRRQIEDTLMKDPSLANLANELLLIIYEYYFGSQPSYESTVLANKLVTYVQGYFGDTHKRD
jgi:hypothetical protein